MSAARLVHIGDGAVRPAPRRRRPSCTLRAISRVAAPCSSTAAAITSDTSDICSDDRPDLLDRVDRFWVARLHPRDLFADLVGRLSRSAPASALTSWATTAKPRPASPARAASMVAFSASRLVCSAIR